VVKIVLKEGVALLLVLVFLIASCIGITNAVSYSIPANGDSWASKAPLPTKRVGLRAAVVHAKIYAIGGYAFDNFLGTTEMYDPATDQWTASKAPMPTRRNHFGIAVYQDQIYVMGGQNNDGITGVNEMYNPDENTWETRASMPTRRYGMDANAVEGKIYVIGGQDAYGRIDGVNEVYDPLTDTWETKAPIPIRVSFYASAVVDNKIYVIGGYTGYQNNNFNQIYDPETNTWSKGASLLFSPLVGSRAAATSGAWAPKKIDVIGTSPPYGITDQPPSKNVMFVNHVPNQIYDPEKDAWSNGTAMPTARISFGFAVVDDMLYAIGGTNGIILPYPLEENQQYTPYEYGTISPVVSVVSPESKNYTSNNLTLAFKVNKPAQWVCYSLDGQDNVTVTGNTTLPILTSGSHTITVYAKDSCENTGASKKVAFTILNPITVNPFSIMLIVAIAGTSAALVGVSLILCFKKRKH
jgi:hypothetical protein